MTVEEGCIGDNQAVHFALKFYNSYLKQYFVKRCLVWKKNTIKYQVYITTSICAPHETG